MDPSRFDRLTRYLGQRTTRRTAVSTSLSAALAGALAGYTLDAAAAQAATSTPIATPEAGPKPLFMFVETFASGRGETNPGAGTPVPAGTPAAGGTPTPGGGAPFLLTLEGHTGLTVYFSDRPNRIVGAVPTKDFLDTLGFSPANPPNAALVAEFKSGQGVAVLKLIEPVYDAQTGKLTYGAEWLQGYRGQNLTPVLADQVPERLPAEFGPSALFIDDCPDITDCIVVCGCPMCTTCTLGPIPGGPYGKCWQGLFKGCQPCWEWETYEYLEGLCNDHYAACNGECHTA